MLQGNDIPLSFAEFSKDSTDFWPAPPDGLSYAEGNALGRARADELVQLMSENHFTALLGRLAEAIAAKGEFGAVEIGFFTQVAAYAVQGEIVGMPRFRAPPADVKEDRDTPNLRLVSSN